MNNLSRYARQDVAQAFGNTLWELRTERDITQRKLAQLSGFNRSYLSQLERGLLQPTLLTILRLAEAFKVAPEVLFTRSVAKAEAVSRTVNQKLNWLQQNSPIQPEENGH